MIIAGVDEVGRGPLAGPVVAAAVILDPQQPISGLRDSKKLSEMQRTKLATIIKKQALAWSIAEATVDEIDSINILQASLLAMQRAIQQLTLPPQQVLVDGNRCPRCDYPTQAIIKGDSKIAEISAASIIAKVFRDELMIQYAELYPDYGFAQHKGYPTSQHLTALTQLGVTPIHRKSFAPVKNIFEN